MLSSWGKDKNRDQLSCTWLLVSCDHIHTSSFLFRCCRRNYPSGVIHVVISLSISFYPHILIHHILNICSFVNGYIVRCIMNHLFTLNLITQKEHQTICTMILLLRKNRRTFCLLPPYMTIHHIQSTNKNNNSKSGKKDNDTNTNTKET